MKEEANVYSGQWFEFFHVEIDEARTIRETEFVCNCAPLPGFHRILDVCCGMGRHARALSNRGYTVTGIDRDPTAVATARELGGGPDYVVADIREYLQTPNDFDAVTVMGQSFGHFDDATNRQILFRLAASIRERGRVMLDVWNPEFFVANQGDRELNSPRGTVRETKRVDRGRLFVQLNYPDTTVERFEWQLFTPEQIDRLANVAGLYLVTSCSGFERNNVPSPDDPRIQFVLERAK